MKIRWSDTQQTIDGFGASSAFFGETITNDVADQLFDAKKGIGSACSAPSSGCPTTSCRTARSPRTAPRSRSPARRGWSRRCRPPCGTKVWATAWTPPPIWKTTNNKNGSGEGYASNKLDPAHYQDYANYLADFVDLMAKSNVPIVALSPANEPDYTASWDGAQWTPSELTTFISENLGPTFAARFPSVKIVAPDTASWPNVDKYLTPLLADPAAKDYLSVVATHPYQNGNAPIKLDYDKPAQNGKRFWQSEWSQENPKGDTPNPTMTSAIDMKRLHDHMVVSNMNAWNWWAIYISATPRERRHDQGPAEPRPHPAGRELRRVLHVQARLRAGELVQVRASGVPAHRRDRQADGRCADRSVPRRDPHRGHRGQHRLAARHAEVHPRRRHVRHAHALGDVARRQPRREGPLHRLRHLHLRSAGQQRGHVRQLGREHRDAGQGTLPGDVDGGIGDRDRARLLNAPSRTTG